MNSRRRLYAAAALAVLAGLGAAERLAACGDKFLVASRGTRYQRAPDNRRPAAILIFSPSASFAPGTLGRDQVDGILRRAGYTPAVASTPEEFERALRRGGWDLVVLLAEDARIAARRLPADATVLPVLVNPSEAEWKQARKEFPVALRAPAKSREVLQAVDRALASPRGSKSRRPQPSI